MFTADLSQIVDFARLIEINNIDRAQKFFGEDARPFNRFVNLSDLKGRRPEIVDVRSGSIELVIAGTTLAAAIIMPLVQVGAQRYFKAADETVTFEVSPHDSTLKQMLDEYEKGQMGTGSNGLTTLVYLLEQRNYNVKAMSDNILLIDHTIKRYSQRIVRTIRKNM